MGRISKHCRARRLRAWIALFALPPLAGCGGAAPSEPPGAWWAGRGAAVRELLTQLAQLEGTPLARRARELAAALPECESVGVHAPDGDAAKLVDGPRCLAPDEPLGRALLASHGDLVFALPASRAQRAEGERRPSSSRGAALHGALRAENGALALDLRWSDPPAEGVLGLLVPGDASAGPDRLASTGRLAALRVRPRAGLDLAALVPEGSQADRLFRLKSGLLASAVLDGTWEAAVYLPERAGGMPGIALALGFSLRRAAVAAIEHFIADLQHTWPVHRSELRRPDGEGACLLDLNVLPDLAPCYVATGDALVVGWNPASLARALAGATPVSGDHRVADPDAPARLDLDLALLQRADDLLARAFPGAEPPLEWPWSRVLASGGADGGALVLRVTFVPLSRSAS